MNKSILIIHLIFSVKYRKKLLSIYGNEIKSDMISLSNKYEFEIIAIEVDKDHIHLLMKYNPKYSISHIVKILKSHTTNNLWRKYPNELKNYFWKKKIFWASGYFVSSIGNANEETIKNYINNQG